MSLAASSPVLRRPLLGLSADRRLLGPHPSHVVGEKYIRAALQAAGGLPVLLPALGGEGGEAYLRAVLERLDGLIFTGAQSNIEPQHYSNEPSYPGNLHDPQRDATTLPLIRLAIAMDKPVLAICRGFQELNVALGGSLHQKVHEVDGLMDHREDPQATLEQQYGPRHGLRFAPGGELERLAAGAEVQVNSLHGQGIARLAPGLVAEAWAPDGLIESVRLERADRFVLGVQWHPEWMPEQHPFNQSLFAAFAAACRQRMSLPV